MNNIPVLKVVSALGVIVTDPTISTFLEKNDPQALKQATEALRNYFNSEDITLSEHILKKIDFNQTSPTIRV